MAHIIGIAFALTFGYWVIWKLHRLPNAVKNVLVIGGGFCLLALQIGILALMIGFLLTGRASTSPWDFVVFSVVGAVLMVWNAFLSLNIAQRLMLMGLYKGMRGQQLEAAPKPYFEANPRVSWTDYRG